MKMDASLVSEFSTSGIYILVLLVSKSVTLTIGRLGKQRFPGGYYSYTGSALGEGATSLKHRIARHLRKEKRKFWHIDYFLSDEKVSIEAVIVAETDENMECKTNQHMKTVMRAKVPAKEFGASDCKKNCKSHLLFFPDIIEVQTLVERIKEYLSKNAHVKNAYAYYLTKR